MNFKQGDLVVMNCEQRTYDAALNATEIKCGTPGTIVRTWSFYESRKLGDQLWAEVWLGESRVAHVPCRNILPLEKV